MNKILRVRFVCIISVFFAEKVFAGTLSARNFLADRGKTAKKKKMHKFRAIRKRHWRARAGRIGSTSEDTWSKLLVGLLHLCDIIR